MSFIIAVHVKEGIVLASDSRQTCSITVREDNLTIKKVGTRISDTVDKTFLCPHNIGISTCGDASIEGTPIGGYIEEFIRTRINESTDVADVPNMLIDFFHSIPEIPNTSFLVAGYLLENGTKVQKVYWLNVLSREISPIDTSSQGAKWGGETKTLSKIIQNTYMRDSDGKELPLGATSFSWNLFTLQDAIDFAQYAVDVTIKTMHYSDQVETVGGPIDILVIKPDSAFWIQHKTLHA